MHDWHMASVNQHHYGALAPPENPVKEVCHGRELGMISGDFGMERIGLAHNTGTPSGPRSLQIT